MAWRMQSGIDGRMELGLMSGARRIITSLINAKMRSLLVSRRIRNEAIAKASASRLAALSKAQTKFDITLIEEGKATFIKDGKLLRHITCPMMS